MSDPAPSPSPPPPMPDPDMPRTLRFLCDPRGELSSKRLIGLVAAVQACAFIWIFVSLGKLDAGTGLGGFLTMLGAGVFGATADHWGPR